MVRLAAVVVAGLAVVSVATANGDEAGSRAKSKLQLCALPLYPCNSGFYCSISGICKPMYKTSGTKRLVDEPCEADDDCLSGLCLDFPSGRCPGGSLFCTNTDLLPNKVCSCYNVDMCITDYSKFLVNSQQRGTICSKDNRCEPCVGIGCLVSQRKNVGEVCRDGGDCKSGSCHMLKNAADGICVCNAIETCQGNQFCLEDDACSSGTCEKSRETQSSVLLEGLSTDVGLCTCSKKKNIACEEPAVCTNDGTCLLPQKGGASCKRGKECIGNCNNNGQCSCDFFNGVPCLEGQYCNSYECFEERLGGESCSNDVECSSKECKSFQCSCDSEHPCLSSGYYCDNTKVCKVRKFGGERCDEVSSLQGDVCKVQGGCVVEGNKGSLLCKCSNEAGKEVTCSGPSVCKYDETCGLPSQGGETCAFDHECGSNNCLVPPDGDLGVCSCTEESTCVNPGDYCKKGAKNKDAWMCAPKLGPDEECELGEHCLSGACPNGRCGCVRQGQSRAATDMFTCPSGKYCDEDGSCAETKIYATECEGAEECKSGNCKSNTCLCMPPPSSGDKVSSQEQAAADATCPDSSTLTCSEDAFCRVKTGLECPDSVASGANEGCADGACFEGKCGKGIGGDFCNGDDNLCQSGSCKDNVCTCDSSELHPIMCRSEAEFCDGDTSQCKPKLVGGLPCFVSGSSMPNQDICESGDCDMQGGRYTCKCSTKVECNDDDTYCKQESFTCESKALASEDCAGQPEPDFCLTGTCLEHEGGEVCSCSPESTCPDQDATFCDLSLGLCLPKRDGGGPCNSDIECIHGTCAGNLCECNKKDTESCENPDEYCASNSCLPKKENQMKCKKGFECLSKACNKRKFCECTALDGLSPCGEGEFCNTKSKKCSQLKKMSKPCKADGDCLSGKCNKNKKCGCRDEDCDNGKVCMKRNNGNFNCVKE